mgnify:CR=1 FL=1
MRSVPTREALKKENQLRTQRKRVAVGEEEQSGLCSDVGCVDKKDTRAHLGTQTATQRQRLRFGKEEQGSGRMTPFLP